MTNNWTWSKAIDLKVLLLGHAVVLLQSHSEKITLCIWGDPITKLPSLTVTRFPHSHHIIHVGRPCYKVPKFHIRYGGTIRVIDSYKVPALACPCVRGLKALIMIGIVRNISSPLLTICTTFHIITKWSSQSIWTSEHRKMKVIYLGRYYTRIKLKEKIGNNIVFSSDQRNLYFCATCIRQIHHMCCLVSELCWTNSDFKRSNLVAWWQWLTVISRPVELRGNCWQIIFNGWLADMLSI